MQIVIRPYAPGDLAQCRALWAELTERHRELYTDPTIGGAEPGLYFDQHLARVGPERLWVADAGQVVGLVGLEPEDETTLIEPVVVARGWRGRGIGRRLLEQAVAEARRLGARYLGIRPVARNLAAIELFHRCGFRLLGQIELFMDLAEGSPTRWQEGAELFGKEFGY